MTMAWAGVVKVIVDAVTEAEALLVVDKLLNGCMGCG